MLLPGPICTASTPQELIAAGVALRDGELATAESILTRADRAAAALAADAAGRADAAAVGGPVATGTSRRTDLHAGSPAPSRRRADPEAEPADDEEPR